MARRDLLTEEERRALFGIPADPDGLARCFTLSRADRDLVAARRGDASRLGYAVQLALLRHPETTLANLGQPVEALVAWMAGRLEIPPETFARYARRPQTVTDHARELAAALGLRPATGADLPFMIATAVVEALRGARIILPAAAVIERVAIAGRARARRRAAEAVLSTVTEAQVAELERLLEIDAALGVTPFAWLKAVPVAPKADHVRELLDRLRRVRAIGLPPGPAAGVHEARLERFVREGHASDAHQLARYAARRRRAILAATVADLEARLTDAVLDMADRLIGGLFARARNAARRRYAASAGDVGRLMRLFHSTIDALAAAQEGDRDAFEAVDEAVSWARLLRVRGEVAELADLAEEDPLLRAASRWRTLRKFAPDLIAALEFRAVRADDPVLAALRLLVELDRSGRREVPPDAPMPFRRAWRRLVATGETPDRRLYETAVLATLRDRLRSGDVWVERSSGYRRFDSYLLPAGAVPSSTGDCGTSRAG